MCRPAYVIKLINHAWLRPYAFHITQWVQSHYVVAFITEV